MFARSMAVSGEYRWLYRLPPFVGQLVAGAAVGPAPEKPPSLCRGGCDQTDVVISAVAAANAAITNVRIEEYRTMTLCSKEEGRTV